MSKKQMTKDKDILKQLEGLKNNAPFDLPEDYFNKLPSRVMNRIRKEEYTASKKPSAFKIVRNQLAFAASFAALVALAYTAIKIIAPETNDNSLTTNEIIASLETDIYDLDETDLYKLAFEEEGESELQNTELTDQEIIDYLLEAGDDLDYTFNDF
jgi:hypothetical protein